MVEGLDLSKIKTWGNPEIRAQLVHKKTLDLVQDFVIEKKENSILYFQKYKKYKRFTPVIHRKCCKVYFFSGIK